MAKTAVQSSRANTMWGKAREKKAARVYHTRNFGTGHVEPDEYYLRRIGLRGRKRWIFLSVVLFAYLLVTGHLVLTCMILGVLRFDSTGPPYFRFNDDGSLVWPQGARITDVRLNSTLDAYNNHSLELTGQNNQQVIFQSGNQGFIAVDNSIMNSSQLSLSPSEIRVNQVKSFAITHSGQPLLFANSSVVIMESLPALRHLRASTGLKTSAVRAPLESNLVVQSDMESLSLRGGNGVLLGGRQINISTENNLNILSLEGSMLISGADGVVLRGLPTQPSNHSSSYHVCACSVTRRLFLVPSNSQRCAAAQDIESICS